MLELLNAFDALCRKYKLRYWLDFGTLLGARRHGGFIPWDDDLDVSMPLDDYRKFMQKAGELPSTIFVQHKGTDPSVPNHYVKLRDRKSLLVEAEEVGRRIDYHQGIFIDIFPVNLIDSSEIRHYKRALFLTKLFSNRFIHLDKFATMGIRYLNRFHNNESGELVVAGGESLHWFEPYAKECLFPLQTMRFEGKDYPVPNDSDHVLRKIFGPDFMKLPPPEKRKSHSILIEQNRPCDKERQWQVQ